jgi:DNA mismatch endonuclease (patch repair protein)
VKIGERAVRPDIVFTRRKVAVFIDGCFWHSCPLHGAAPRKNTSYWDPKLARNRERDVSNNELLAAAGWIVIRAWEHTSPEETASKVTEAVARRT